MATRPTYSIPSWFYVHLHDCLAIHESSIHNSWAGYYGMISPPSHYPGSAAIVGQYGNSWYGIPRAAQDVIVYAEWRAVGTAGWPNTGPICGL